MPLYQKIVLCFTLLFISHTASAELLTLKQAESLALQHNPALAATKQQAEAMATMPAQAASLADPKLSFKALNLPVDSFSTTQENMTQLQLGLSQALPFPGKLGLKSDIAEHMARAAQHSSQEFRLLLLRNTRIHWWNLAYLDQALSIVRSNQQLLRRLVRIAETKYKTGKGLQQDVLLAQLELSKLLEKELHLQGIRKREAARLYALIGSPTGITMTLPKLEPKYISKQNIDVVMLKNEVRHTRPMLLAMDEKVQASAARIALADKGYYPDFNLGAAYGFRQGVNPANKQSRPDFTSVMLTMSLPIYTDHKQDKRVAQRKAEKARAQFSWQDAVDQVEADIDAAASDLRIARSQVALFEQGILPQARQTTASMLAGYQVNKVDFLNLVRAQLSEFNTDMRYWKQISLVHQAEARLAAAAGKDNLYKDDNHE